MFDMSRLIWVPVIVVVYALARIYAWYLLEGLRPFEYTCVPFAGLRKHIRDVCLRGLNKCRLVMTEETSGISVLVLKTFRYRAQRNLHLRILAIGVDRAEAGSDNLQAELEAIGADVSFGIKVKRRRYDCLVADCGTDIDKVTSAVVVVLQSFHGLSDDAVFRVRVDGDVSWADEPMAFGETRGEVLRRIVAPQQRERGKPYKHCMVPRDKRVNPFIEIAKTIFRKHS